MRVTQKTKLSAVVEGEEEVEFKGRFTVIGRQECRCRGCAHAGKCSCHLQAVACVGVDLVGAGNSSSPGRLLWDHFLRFLLGYSSSLPHSAVSTGEAGILGRNALIGWGWSVGGLVSRGLAHFLTDRWPATQLTRPPLSVAPHAGKGRQRGNGRRRRY